MNNTGHKMLEKHGDGNSWRKVADEFGVSPSMAWRIAKEGYEPQDNEIRAALGWPLIVKVQVSEKKELENVLLPWNVKILNCRSCQRPFIRLHPRQVYCDPSCRP